MVEFKILQAATRAQIGTYRHWGPEITFGSADAEFILDDPELDARQLFIGMQQGGAVVESLSEQVPVKLNVQTLLPGAPMAVKAGDKITLGKTLIQVIQVTADDPPVPGKFEHPKAADIFAEGTTDRAILDALAMLKEKKA